MLKSAKVRKFYASTAWKQCRNAYVSSVGGLCEKCYSKGIATAGNEVHHKVKLNDSNVDDPSIALNFENLVLLCYQCHGEQHRIHERRWRVDADGRLIAPMLEDL